MVATVYLLFDYQRDGREALARAQGLDLPRLPAGMSWSELVPEPGKRGYLEILNLLAINPYEPGGVVAQRKPVRMHEFPEDAFTGISQARGDKDLEFDLDIPREMSMVYIDEDLFRIAVNNLMFLEKPVSIDNLVEKARRLFRRHHG